MAYQYTIKIIFFVCSLFFYSCKQDNSVGNIAILTDKDRLSLHEGDFVLRRGKGFVSQFIIDQLNDSTNLSHIGILTNDNGVLNVIHCLGDEFSSVEGMQICTLDEYLSDCYNDGLLVVRSRKCDSRRISALAKEYLNKKIPFDRKFDFEDSTAFSCLELPYNIFKSLNISYKDMECFRPFQDTTRFQIVLDKRNALR